MIAARPDVRRRLIEVCGEDAEIWWDGLPGLIARLTREWDLHLEDQGWGNYSVAAAGVQRGHPVVLKASPQQLLEPEMLALRTWGASGAVEVLSSDLEAGAMLIERAIPGQELTRMVEQGEDEKATAIACEMMRRLPKAAVSPGVWATAADRAADLARIRQRYDGGEGPFPKQLLEHAEGAFAELVPSQGPQVLIHGDLHHENILSAEREPWLVIDPHGMVAEAEYETYALLKNPTGVASWPDVVQVTRRRIDQMADLLGYDRRRITGWGIAGAVLSAWWTLEAHGFDYEDDLRMAEIISAIE